jgi:hypothetical protein
MRLAIVGAQNVGKSTLIQAIKKFWPMYESPAKTYRDVIAEKKLTINKDGTFENQKIIQDAICDIAQEYASKTHVVHDRSILDNAIYTFYLADKVLSEGNNVDDDYMTNMIVITRETLKLYDIIFWLPINPNIKMEESNDNPNRSTDIQYQQDINTLFESVYDSYRAGEGVLFPLEDSPAMIKLEGLDLNAKIDELKLYINPEGNLLETEKSVFSELEQMYDEAKLLKQVKSGSNS